MSSGFDEFWDRHMRSGGSIPPEFGGPTNGVSGKQYTQMEFDFGEVADEIEKQVDLWKLKNDVSNQILQANGIIKLVMDSIGTGGGEVTEDHEFALWGASEILQKAAEMLE